MNTTAAAQTFATTPFRQYLLEERHDIREGVERDERGADQAAIDSASRTKPRAIGEIARQDDDADDDEIEMRHDAAGPRLAPGAVPYPRTSRRAGADARARAGDAVDIAAFWPPPLADAAPPRGAGVTAVAKPSFAASLSRASAWPTGRTSPERPISPKTTVSAGTGSTVSGRDQRRRDREIGGGLGDAQAAGDVEIDVARADLQRRSAPPARPAPWRGGCRPSRPRRGAACRAGRRDQRLDLDQHRPRALHAGEDRGAAHLAAGGRRGTAPTGSALRPSPRSVISKTPISSVGPKRFLTARRMRN